MTTSVTTPRHTPLHRTIMLATPAAFAVLTLFHPLQDPPDVGNLNLWMAVHLLQLCLTVLLAYAIWFLLEDLSGREAQIARLTLPVFLVFFSTFDAVAGIATGWLMHTADDQTGELREHTHLAIEDLFSDNWLAGNFSVVGSIAGTAWIVIALTTALAMQRAGADRLTWGLMAASLLFTAHPPPTGTLGMLALLAASYRWDRHQRRTSTAPATSARP
jgi:hypothetical protein